MKGPHHHIRGLLTAAACLAAACSDSDITGESAGHPVVAADFRVAHAAATVPISLDQLNGSNWESGTVLLKGFNPTNPHRGDAVVATFFWFGSTNIIRKVSDHLSNGTAVGNKYRQIAYVTSGGISMSTWVALNVQNFPDAYGVAGGPQDSILVIEADLAEPVPDGGVQITAYDGVGSGKHAFAGVRSASGSDSGIAIAGPGPLKVGTAGSLVHAVTMTVGLGGVETPSGFTEVGVGSDAWFKNAAAYTVAAAPGVYNPRWVWYFDRPFTWLATVFALKPAQSGP